MSYFNITGRNYIGTPRGVLATNKTIEQIDIYDLTEKEEEEYTYKYIIEANGMCVYSNDKIIGYYINGFYYHPEEVEAD